MNARGNALFLILIAVALFAALSYAITQSGRGGGGIEREQAEIKAAELIQYASNFEQAATRMKLIGGCSDNEFSFQRDWDGDGTIEDNLEDFYNANAPADGTCHFFDANGGGIIWDDPDNDVLDGSTGETWRFSNSSCIEDIGTNGTGTASGDFCDGNTGATDLISLLPGINRTVCQVINRNLHGDNTIPVEPGHFTGSMFIGTYGSGTEIGDVAELMKAKPAYCFQASSASAVAADAYVFYHLILAR